MKTLNIDTKDVRKFEIMINGAKYVAYPFTLDLQRTVEKFVSVSGSYQKELRNIKKNDDTTLSKIVIKYCSLVRETINAFFGKGSYEQIFKNSTVNFADHQQLMGQIFDAITEFKKSYDKPAD